MGPKDIEPKHGLLVQLAEKASNLLELRHRADYPLEANSVVDSGEESG